MVLISGMMTYSSFLCNCFLERAAVGSAFLFLWRRVTDSWDNIYLYHGEPVGSFAW